MALEEYRRKRDFAKTPEPAAQVAPAGEERHFVVQKHHATRLHYDFRLEMDGVLKSWAVPKGPTLDAGEKRLAMMVEDHPLSYMLFEGIIPAGNYGAGTVMVWDTGTWQCLQPDASAALAKGDLKFVLNGQKLKGEFAIVHMRSRRPGSKGNEWLLLKKKDAFVQPGWDAADFDWSVVTGRSLAQIAADEESGTWESSRKTQPKGKRARIARTAKSDEEELRRARRQAAERTLKMTRKLAGEPGAAAQGESVDPSQLRGAVKANMPAQIVPMLATLVREAKDDPEWLYEIKWDGVRAIAFLDGGKLRLQSRSRRDITACYPDLASVTTAARARSAILDGEIVTLDTEGRSSFSRLQQRMNTVPDARLLREYPVVFYAFDLLYLDGYDLRRVPLAQRKAALAELIGRTDGGRIRYSDHQEGQGKELARAAAERQLEGIIGKRRESLYEGKRSREWEKIKTVQEAEAVIGGYTDPRGARQHFGSLMLGQWRDGKLVHVGNAGAGFTQASQKQVWEKLKELRTSEKPFAGKTRSLAPAHWLKPEMMARVKFVEWTNDGKMRAPVVLEVTEPGAKQAVATPASTARTDASPEAALESRSADKDRRPAKGVARAGKQGPAKLRVVPKDGAAAGALDPGRKLFTGDADKQTVELGGHRLAIQNLNKVFFPRDGYTKRDVIEYYYGIAPLLLPYMQARPLTMKRYPNGIDGKFFFQKDAAEVVPAWVPKVRIKSEHGKTPYIHQAVCNDTATLVLLANYGCIDHHLWLSHGDTLDNPDFILFDIDPGEKATFAMVMEVMLVLKDALEDLGLAAYPKTSGATGMHVWVPLAPDYTYEVTRNFCQLVYEMALPRFRKLVTFERSLRKRPKDRIYLDYQQNAVAKSVPPPYSLRPHDGAPVSTPLEWKEVKRGLDPSAFTMATIGHRLREKGDLYRGVLEEKQHLEDAFRRIEEVYAPAAASR